MAWMKDLCRISLSGKETWYQKERLSKIVELLTLKCSSLKQSTSKDNSRQITSKATLKKRANSLKKTIVHRRNLPGVELVLSAGQIWQTTSLFSSSSRTYKE